MIIYLFPATSSLTTTLLRLHYGYRNDFNSYVQITIYLYLKLFFKFLNNIIIYL
jgi:hypothetical protein